MTTKITEQNISNLSNIGIDWQTKVTSDGSTVTTMAAGKGYFVDNTSAAGLVKLPLSASAGDTIVIKDYAGNFGTNSLTIQRNGHNIQGNANNSQLETNRASVILVYIDATKGWLYTNESNVAELGAALYVAATGGTVTTSGNFKIHSFTGDGCFVVSCAGNPSGSNTVDYLVVAGGGSGGTGGTGDGGAGGGAGGYRESSGAASGCYTASPLGACVSALSVTAQTYPITVGAGGGGQPSGNSVGNKGSNSVFSTITSAGGGGGDGNGVSAPSFTPACGSGAGGSGGGGHQNAGGQGNQPPVSPPQGNDGGNGSTPTGTPSGAGGGGAGSVGSNASNYNPGPNNGGPGGNGQPSNITGSDVTRAGGGGGSNSPSRPSAGTQGTGGPGGGGTGGGTAGTANTGGGGGGMHDGTSGGGGKGIVILRYKFQ